MVAPSILNADFTCLKETIEGLNASNADYLHVDIMDGQFVPPISFGASICSQIYKISHLPLDVHLMVNHPVQFIEQFAEAGASVISVHWEADANLHRTIRRIKDLGCKAGVAINPHTPPDLLKTIIHEIDTIIVMSVNPGYGGQKYLGFINDKLNRLKEMKHEENAHFLIEVDGGVTLENAGAIKNAGGECLVAGSAVVNHQNPVEAIEIIRKA